MGSDFETFYDGVVRAHYVRLTTFAYRMLGSWAAAEDAVQDVLFRIWHRRPSIDPSAPLPYLYQAVKHECLMALRREGRRQERDLTATAQSATQSPDESADVRQAVEQAIAALPERCRVVFTMSREQELTYGEIAGILGISIKTVETQMGRALKTLRRLLASHLHALLIL
jgi:RNA polymerase sigma-70 factor, ECF subfamily